MQRGKVSLPGILMTHILKKSLNEDTQLELYAPVSIVFQDKLKGLQN